MKDRTLFCSVLSAGFVLLVVAGGHDLAAAFLAFVLVCVSGI